MRVFSREVCVGFFLVLAVVLSGCRPIQPVAESSATPTGVVIVESGPVTDTATLSETVAISSEVGPGESIPVAESPTATSAQEDAIPIDPVLIEAGLATYRAQYCGVCHWLDAAETRGVFGPTHNNMRATAESYLANGQYQGAAATAAEYIRESIVDPQAFIAPGFATTSHRMPSYAHLDSASVDALVALLLAQ